MSASPEKPNSSLPTLDLPDLPAGYDDNRVLLMAIDPFDALAFWDFSEIVENALVERVPPPAKKILRVYDVTGLEGLEGALSWDFAVEADANRALPRIGQPGREFVAAVGYVGAENRFHSLGESNRIRLPALEPKKKLARRFGRWDPQSGSFAEDPQSGEKPEKSVGPIPPMPEPQPGRPSLQGAARHWLRFSQPDPKERASDE